jgi:hypothetical protein
MLSTKNLVIGVVGDKSLHNKWIKNKKNFDLMLVYFGKEKEKYKKDCQYWLENVNGTKWNIIYNLNKNIIKNYKYVFFPDDDIDVNSEQIEHIFALMRKHRLWLSQPAIKGFVSDEFTKKIKGNKLRFTNWVEIMCPCFEINALNRCWNTFNENKTNWGIAHLWNLNLKNPINKIAILDCVEVNHTRALGTGENYKNNFNRALAMKELNHIFKKYDLKYEKIVYDKINLKIKLI